MHQINSNHVVTKKSKQSKPVSERVGLHPGPITEQFESEVAAIFGKKFGVMVNSGSSANVLALLIAGLKAGDEVVTLACTFSTTVAPLFLGLVPIFCDVQIGSYVASVGQVIEKVTPHKSFLYS
jgi:CDP-6-deoxy-D-xylo-4-hexulose-3-dehydrase